MSEEAFFALFHAGLPRLGPGTEADTAQALSLVSGLPPSPKILDVGCGNGAQTLALARLLPEAEITAVDLYGHFLEELERRASRAGCLDRLRLVQGDMGNLAFEPGAFDLVWSEGAAYHIGFAKALASWRRLVRPGGTVALSDIGWFKPNPPEDLRAFWDVECPGMELEADHVPQAVEAGYVIDGLFRLPARSWWTEFYTPLSEELQRFCSSNADKPDWLAVADMTRRELDMHRRYGDWYGYTFYVCRRPD